jgi:non-canonical poly(A) RNA polymerase PAPD5/7
MVGLQYNYVMAICCLTDKYFVGGNINARPIAETGSLQHLQAFQSVAEWLRDECIDDSISPTTRLHNEILQFCDYVQLTEEEKANRAASISDLRALTEGLWPNTELHVFGSELTGLLLPTSDIDIALLNCRRGELQVLRALAAGIREAGMCSQIEVVANAKVPIVKMEHKHTRISVDISVNTDSGLKTGQIMLQYIKDAPALKPLALVLKMFLVSVTRERVSLLMSDCALQIQRKLNESYLGGIGSFMLVLMIMFSIQSKIHHAGMKGLKSRSKNLGFLLMDFFDLFGRRLNPWKCGISTRRGGSIFDKRKYREFCMSQKPGIQQMLLAVENPFQSELDVGRNTRELSNIRQVFNHAYHSLRLAMSKENVMNIESLLGVIINSDDPCLKGRYQG